MRSMLVSTLSGLAWFAACAASTANASDMVLYVFDKNAADPAWKPPWLHV